MALFRFTSKVVDEVGDLENWQVVARCAFLDTETNLCQSIEPVVFNKGIISYFS